MSSVTMLGRRTTSVLAVWMDPVSPPTLPLHSHSSWNLIFQFHTFSINNCLYRFDSFEKRDVFNEFFKVSFGLGWVRMVESPSPVSSVGCIMGRCWFSRRHPIVIIILDQRLLDQTQQYHSFTQPHQRFCVPVWYSEHWRMAYVKPREMYDGQYWLVSR